MSYKNNIFKKAFKPSTNLLEIVSNIMFKYDALESKYSNPIPKIYKNFLLKYPEGVYKIKGKPIRILVRKRTKHTGQNYTIPQKLRCFFGLDINDNVVDWIEHLRGKYTTNPMSGKPLKLVGSGFIPIGEFWNGDILLLDMTTKTTGYVYLLCKDDWGGPGTFVKKDRLIPQAVNLSLFFKNILNFVDNIMDE